MQSFSKQGYPQRMRRLRRLCRIKSVFISLITPNNSQLSLFCWQLPKTPNLFLVLANYSGYSRLLFRQNWRKLNFRTFSVFFPRTYFLPDSNCCDLNSWDFIGSPHIIKGKKSLISKPKVCIFSKTLSWNFFSQDKIEKFPVIFFT